MPKSGNRKSSGKRSSFQWTSEIRMGMAEYIRTNFELYKKSLGSQKKMEFLRKMKEFLNLNCDDGQLKNGFNHFIQKYNDIESSLSQSGFGIDPEKDKTLDKGWIYKKCPYYDVLNEVMGTRPNLRPPYTISTSVEDLNVEVTAEIPESTLVSDATFVLEPEDPSDTASSTFVFAETPKTLPDVVSKKCKERPKSPLDVFAKLMAEKSEGNSKIAEDRLNFDREKYYRDEEYKREQLALDKEKFNYQHELEERRLRLEEKKLENESELQKLKLQQEYELKKYELELKYNKSC